MGRLEEDAIRGPVKGPKVLVVSVDVFDTMLRDISEQDIPSANERILELGWQTLRWGKLDVLYSYDPCDWGMQPWAWVERNV